MNAPALIAHLLAMLLMPVLLVGLINRSKSWWVGRRGPGLFQSAHDLRRLLRKTPVVSHTATPLFRFTPYLQLGAVLLAMTMAPLLGAFAPIQFGYDFVAALYLLGLSRAALMLSAMEVGSAFEGMGAAREASFSSFAEPVLMLVLASLMAGSGMSTFASLMHSLHQGSSSVWLTAPLVLVLLVLLQVEASRVPVDDPGTHLELTMVHEVMVLDHSGPDLAAIQWAAALKLSLYAGLIAALLNPFDFSVAPLASAACALGLMMAVAVVVGSIESLSPRLPLRWVPRYLLLALGAALITLLAISLRAVGA